ncbi:peptidoglycan bridge formation glycyltransferase FemA/FemB family protein [Candidatus Dojkabacteria bacterium]|nr:peptidoglycan bridge formation glycyltransferase FemA/FemB family protein [Candidatus Dojkabacteria bacterium]
MEIKQIEDKSLWEKFILKQNYSSPFLSWNWAEFERSLGNKFENYGLFEGKNLIGLIPIKYVDAKRGKYLHLRHGPIFNFNKEEIWAEFFKFIIRKARDEKFWFVRLSPLIPQDLELKYGEVLSRLKESPMHDVDAEITWVLNLSQSEEEIMQNMRKNTRYYIRKAIKDGVEILKTKNPKYLEEFWNIYSDTVKRQKWTAYSRDYIEKEFNAFVSDDEIDLYLAKYKGEFIAASLILYYQNQAIYHHSGTIEQYLKIPASYLIQWEAIKEAKRRNLSWYNFWGISPLVMEDGEYKAQAGHPWTGLTFFKLGFGGEVRQFVHAKDLPINKKYFVTRFFEKIEKWRRGY